MTTLVHTRHPLQILSMSNQGKRRRNERASSYDDQDGDFQFTRAKATNGVKRVKTALQAAPIPEEEPEFVPTAAVKKTTRPKQQKKTLPPSLPPQTTAPKRVSKRKSNQVTQDDVPEPELQPSPPPPAAQPKTTRRKAARAFPDDEEEEPRPKKAARGAAKKASRVEEPVEDDMDMIDTGAREETPEALTKTKGASQFKKIALPFADTPVINRNKEMRKKTGGGRRSSLGMRGRRASSLIESGNNAIPHRAVDTAQFYKHISSEGLVEPKRMKQLLTWCAERALAEKPPLGSLNANAIHGARAIQDQLLKDFASKSEFSDWFTREEVPKPPAIVKPNPRNIEHDEKIAELEERLQRLRAEKKTWQAIKAAPVDQSPLFPTATTEEAAATSNRPQTATLPLPEASLLDPDESKMLETLVTPTSALSLNTSQVRSRLQILQQSLEFRIDHLADSVHKVEQRVLTAGRQADKVLSLSAVRLKERADRERASAGTREMPVMEVLRSLGRILPEGGG